MDTPRNRRNSYHHGDLRNALVRAATDLARAGGPEAVVLREAARRVGVSATAAYRHFGGHGDLLRAVKEQAKEALADEMEASLGETPSVEAPAADAERRMRALGRGYLRFARAEPGLYRTAFCHGPPPREMAPDQILQVRAFTLLSRTLDEYVTCGRMPPARRPFAETVAWACVHGLALLILDGPLATFPATQIDQAVEHAIDVMVAGLGRS